MRPDSKVVDPKVFEHYLEIVLNPDTNQKAGKAAMTLERAKIQRMRSRRTDKDLQRIAS
jgi:hypothetical protein